MNLNNICIFVLIIFLCFIIFCNCTNFFKNEGYTPIIYRPLPCNKSQNNCKFPFTNNKLDTTSNKNVYTYQYSNRFLLNPDNYLVLIKKLLNDLSTKKINVSKIPDSNLLEINYEGDPEYITNFLNDKINELVKTKNYLHNNGSWKYEYFTTSEPTIFYYKIKDSNTKIFKIIYTLGNPLRSSYTSCIAFISNINNKLNIEFTSILNDIDHKNIKDNLDVIPKEALEFSFIDTIANVDFNKYGYTSDYSGLNYIQEHKDPKINIKADIPSEFKENSFQPQYLPPLFGNGICNYPPFYKMTNGETKYFNIPPLTN
jgi:hypothetical protein